MLVILAFFVFTIEGYADSKFIVVQSTTSTQNSGLLDYVLPQFTEQSGIEVRVVAVGTGQAIKNARNGDGDVLLVHAKSDELAFVADGFGIERYDLMYNDFVIVGPKQDPAAIRSSQNVASAFAKIAQNNMAFISRGDNSGTHKKELSLWKNTNVDTVSESGTWYRESGSGMGATLNMASAMKAYTLTDRATWISFKNKGELAVL
ncbi:MAG: substrate-binding domain-containing protein, partial [Pseudomonadota bacterium]